MGHALLNVGAGVAFVVVVTTGLCVVTALVVGPDEVDSVMLLHDSQHTSHRSKFPREAPEKLKAPASPSRSLVCSSRSNSVSLQRNPFSRTSDTTCGHELSSPDEIVTHNNTRHTKTETGKRTHTHAHDNRGASRLTSKRECESHNNL